MFVRSSPVVPVASPLVSESACRSGVSGLSKLVSTSTLRPVAADAPVLPATSVTKTVKTELAFVCTTVEVISS